MQVKFFNIYTRLDVRLHIFKLAHWKLTVTGGNGHNGNNGSTIAVDSTRNRHSLDIEVIYCETNA